MALSASADPEEVIPSVRGELVCVNLDEGAHIMRGKPKLTGPEEHSDRGEQQFNAGR